MESRPGLLRHAPLLPELSGFGAAILAFALSIAGPPTRADDAGGDALLRKANREAYERIQSGNRNGAELLKEVMAPALQAREAEVRKRVQEEMKENARLSRERAKRAGKESAAPASPQAKQPPQAASPPLPAPDSGPAIDGAGVPSEIIFDPADPARPGPPGSRSFGSPPPAEGGVDEIEF